MLLHTYTHCSGGIGDFIRSVFAYYVYTKKNNIEFDIYIKGHPFEKCFKSRDDVKDVILLENFGSHTDNKTKEILEMIKNKNKIFIIKSNIFDFISFKELKENRKDFLFFLFNKLEENIKDKIENLSNLLNIQNMIAIHVRCGDDFMNSAKNYSKDLRINPETALKKIKELQNRYNDLILFTDNEWLKKQVSIKTIPTESIHTAFTKDVEGCINTLVEFFVMGNSTSIIVLSNSGFSYWSAFINGITLYEYNEDTLKEFTKLDF